MVTEAQHAVLRATAGRGEGKSAPLGELAVDEPPDQVLVDRDFVQVQGGHAVNTSMRAAAETPVFELCRSERRRSGSSAPGVQCVLEDLRGSVPHPGHMSVGPNQHGGGSSDLTDCRKFPRPTVLSID